eukprot:GSChrysophyteH1.ASY1.ANO1.747.1 assembled CDS
MIIVLLTKLFVLCVLLVHHAHCGREQKRFTGEVRFKEKRNVNRARFNGEGIPGNSMDHVGIVREETTAGGFGLLNQNQDSQDKERMHPKIPFVQMSKHANSAEDDFTEQISHTDTDIPKTSSKKNSKGSTKTKSKTSKSKAKSKTDKASDTEANERVPELTALEQSALCPRKCAAASGDELRTAILHYWNRRSVESFDCACAVLGQSSGSHHMAHAIMYALTYERDSSVNSVSEGITDDSLITNSEGEVGNSTAARAVHVPVYPPREAPPSVIPIWEVLAPLPVGKLEVDADPAFSMYEPVRGPLSCKFHVKEFINEEECKLLEPIMHILTMPTNVSVSSDLSSGGRARWQNAHASAEASAGMVGLRFDANWAELVQGVSSRATLEFQGWARTSTYVRKAGIYGLFCQGVHTAYLVNDGLTRLLVGDVYSSGSIVTTVDLQVGPVGIVLPLRGTVGTQFLCQITEEIHSSDTLLLLPLRNVPHLLELGENVLGTREAVAAMSGKGLLLTGVFTLPVHNTQSHPLSLSFGLEPPSRFTSKATYGIRLALSSRTANVSVTSTHTIKNAPIVVGPGQVAHVPLEIVTESATTISDAFPTLESRHTFLPCRGGYVFSIIVTPSRGEPKRTDLQFPCRHSNQSFHISYIDHDGAVGQAALLLPLPEKGTKGRNARFRHRRRKDAVNGARKRRGDAGVNATRPTVKEAFPILLSLHGTGVSALSQADAYKYKSQSTPETEDFTFGVEGLWVVAPTRFGAHNWEHVGELSAKQSIVEAQGILSRYPEVLPQMLIQDRIVGGHSMGGHGAWMLAVNDPDSTVCVLPTASWTAKEHYDVGNAFFHLDVQNSYTSPDLVALLARSMSEFHVDQLAGNLLSIERIHMRVGSEDTTTHPYFSRRMKRVLLHRGHTGVKLEEVPQKGHWWWDSAVSNDGGVMNDEVMRGLYRDCLLHARSRQRYRRLQQRRSTVPVDLSESNEAFSSTAASNSSNLNDDGNSSYDNVNGDGDGVGDGETPILSSEVKAKNMATSSVKRQDQKEQPVLFKKDEESFIVTQSLEDIYDEELEQNACIEGAFSIDAINLAHSQGSCGLRILQQQQQLSRSRVEVQCVRILDDTESIPHGDGNLPREQMEKLRENSYSCMDSKTCADADDEADSGRESNLELENRLQATLVEQSKSLLQDKSRRCHVLTTNVQRLSIHFWGNSSVGALEDPLFKQNRLAEWYIDGYPMEFSHADGASVDVCFSARSGRSGNPLGPQTGQPSVCKEGVIDTRKEKSPNLQGPIRMIASKPLLIVYGTPRKSELRVAIRDFAVYLANAYTAAHGSYVRAITDLEYRSGGYSSSDGSSTTNAIFIGGPESNKVSRTLFDQKKTAPHMLSFDHDSHSITIGPHRFDLRSHAAIFAFPYISAPEQQPGLAVCIVSESARGYSDMSKLAWPTVPPMVRAPFANYIPDYMVIDGNIWAEGFGSVTAAGFWNTAWEFDATQSYIR